MKIIIPFYTKHYYCANIRRYVGHNIMHFFDLFFVYDLCTIIYNTYCEKFSINNLFYKYHKTCVK